MEKKLPVVATDEWRVCFKKEREKYIPCSFAKHIEISFLPVSSWWRWFVEGDNEERSTSVNQKTQIYI